MSPSAPTQTALCYFVAVRGVWPAHLRPPHLGARVFNSLLAEPTPASLRPKHCWRAKIRPQLAGILDLAAPPPRLLLVRMLRRIAVSNGRAVLVYFLALLLLLSPGRFAGAADVSKDLTKIPIADSPSYAKVALVIGVSDYKFARKLNDSNKDARAFYDLLVHQFKFDPLSVTLLTDEPGTPEEQRPSFAYLKHAVNLFLERVDRNSEVVFFYSGHGVRTGDEDYLVPLDADLDDIVGTCVSYDKLKRQLETKTPRRALLITDACRNLSPAKGDTGSGFGQGSASDLPQMAEMFSCQPTQVSWEGSDFQEGVFTHYLLAGLKGDPEASTPGGLVTFDSLQQYVRGKVEAYSAAHFGRLQEPIGRATLGSMVLARGEGNVIVNPVDTIAHLDLASEPAGAKVFVDGQDTGKVTPCNVGVDLGVPRKKAVEIGLELGGCKPLVRTITLQRGVTLPVIWALERLKPQAVPFPGSNPLPGPPAVNPVRPPAHIHVTSEPPGAKVYVDGEVVGTTPCTLDKDFGGLKTKQIEVRVETQGFRPSVRTMDMERGTWYDIDCPLERIYAAPIAALNPKDGSEMVYVPAGPFVMGDDHVTNNPRRTVTLDAFWIYKNDVTVAQYRKFCQATGREMPTAPEWRWKDDHPIVNVSWDDAHAYCEWAGAALPTEAQWEKAARGTDGRKYPWGDQWDSAKLQCSKKAAWDAGSTAPVGSCPAGASPYGCLDMAGNVQQWCADRLDVNYQKSASQKNPTGPSFDFDVWRVLRGGSWHFREESSFRCAFRNNFNVVPSVRLGDLGFRAVRAGLN